MRQIKRKTEKDKIAAVLMLCFCLIALTSIFTIKASIDKVTKSAMDLPVNEKSAVSEKEDKNADKPLKQESKSDTEETASQIPTVDSKNKPAKSQTFVSPVDENSASISKKYSMDMVIYNATLDQFMTHPGIDMEGKESSNVIAISNGTVTDVSIDDAYGTTVEINHSNGLLARYCCLKPEPLVEKGDTVKQNQVIGCIGNSAMYESSDSPHLHFEILKDGKLIDPAKIIDLSL